jgi:hypothetical protein
MITELFGKNTGRPSKDNKGLGMITAPLGKNTERLGGDTK